jgi:hypothetical protein
MSMHSRTPLRNALTASVIALSLIATACGGDDDAATTTTPPSVGSTATVASTTTSTAPPTTVGPTTTTATTTTAAATTTIDTNSLASGSGCTPGTEDLPDGEWFGYVDSAADDEIEFDLACWFSGDAAILATAEDGKESPPPNDYYVRNVNPQLRSITIAADAQVAWLPNPGGPDLETISYAEWLGGRDLRGVEFQPGVWLTIEDGEVTEMTEQYVP